jgi:hypothetical protein
MRQPLPDEPKKPTMLGKLLNNVRFARWSVRQKAIDDLWKRNGLENPALRKGWKLAETTQINRDGTEIVEYRLYKLMDSSVTKITSEVKSEIQTGLDKLKENKE